MTGWRIRDYHADDVDGILRLWEQVTAANAEPVYNLAGGAGLLREGPCRRRGEGDQRRRRGHRACRARPGLGGVPGDRVRCAGARDRLFAARCARGADGTARDLQALRVDARRRNPGGAFLQPGVRAEAGPALFRTAHPGAAGGTEDPGRARRPGHAPGAVGCGRRDDRGEGSARAACGDAARGVGAGRPVRRGAAARDRTFGPPGTGKTTFAKAIASRLEWSFVEVFPSRLASDPGGLAGALRETFMRIAELEHAVVFIDEVEEIASHRQGEPPSPTQGVTNELLKIIPAFREQPGRLLICATNFIRRWTPRSCATAGSTTSSRSACPTSRPEAPSGSGTSRQARSTSRGPNAGRP